MTTIKTTCSMCGDVELKPADLVLELSPSEDEGTYRFTCPECSGLERRPANARVVSVVAVSPETKSWQLSRRTSQPTV